MFDLTSSGDTKNMEAFLKSLQKGAPISSVLHAAGKEGVAALAKATPVDTRLAASSWDYFVEETKDSYTIQWINTNEEGGLQVVILLQYGHGTGTGGYVQGRDFINPAMKPIFDRIADKVWKAVTSA